MTTDTTLAPAALALYQATLPVMQQFLQRISLWLQRAEQSDSASVLLQIRLHPDMLPLQVQVEISANFALRTCWPLCGQPIPAYGDFPASYAGLQQRLHYVQTQLAQLHPHDFTGCEQRTLHSRAGHTDIHLPASDFVHHYAMPNFFFHCSMVYALLRQGGVALGKADFDGMHIYPKG